MKLTGISGRPGWIPTIAVAAALILSAGCGGGSTPGNDFNGNDSGAEIVDPGDIPEDSTSQDLPPADSAFDSTDSGIDSSLVDTPDGSDGTAVDTYPDATDESFADTQSDAKHDLAGPETDVSSEDVTQETGWDTNIEDTVSTDSTTTDPGQPDIVDQDVTITDPGIQDTGLGDSSVTDQGNSDAGTEDPGIADTGNDTPVLTAIRYIVPESAIRDTAFRIDVFGTGLNGSMSVRLSGDSPLTAGYSATAQSVSLAAAGQLAAEFDAGNGLIPGFYRVELVDGGLVADSISGFRILPSGSASPVVTAVSPDTAKSGRDRMVVVSGSGFANGASVVLAGNGNAWESSFTEVADSGSLTAVIPSGTDHIPVGLYELWVVNPDGLSGKWDRMFRISDLAPPTIISVSPVRAGNADPAVLTVTGMDFQEGAIASLTGPGGEIPLATRQETETIETVLTATVPAGLATGVYPLKVTNPDEQFDTYYFYQVSNNSPGSLTTFEMMTESMNTPRWQHTLDPMTDGMGRGFLVAAGGIDSSGNPLDGVEISQVSPNGAPGAWKTPVQTDPDTGLRIQNTLRHPRIGAASARSGRTLFIFGGRSSNGSGSLASDTVETARILGRAGSPGLKAPTHSDAGFLPEGRWIYRVSAVTSRGETLASASVSGRGPGGAYTISWEPVSGARAFNIYRCPAADCRPDEEIAVAWMVPAQSGRSFTDDGQGTLTPSPGGVDLLANPADPGAITQVQYSYVVTSVVESEPGQPFESTPGVPSTVSVPGGSGTVSIYWNDVPAATSYRIYRAQGTGPMRLIGEVEAGVVNFDDLLENTGTSETPPTPLKPLPAGSLSLFEFLRDRDDNQILLNTAREGARATFVKTQYDETDPDALTGVLIVVGGRNGLIANAESLKTSETLPVFIDGSVGMPTLEQATLRTGRSFFGLGNSQERLDNLGFEDDDDDDPVTPDCPDFDKDGFFDAACGGKDCDDKNPLVNPAAPEDLLNGIDDNCDGLVDVPTQGWETFESPSGGLVRRILKAETDALTLEPVFLMAVQGNGDVKTTNDTGRQDIEAIGVDLTTGHLFNPVSGSVPDWILQNNTDNGPVTGLGVALYQKFLFTFMGVGSENLGQIPSTLNSQSNRFQYCPEPLPGDAGDPSFGCPGYADWTHADLAGTKRTSANATVSGGLGYYGISRAFGYIYLVAGVDSAGVSGRTWRVLQ